MIRVTMAVVAAVLVLGAGFSHAQTPAPADALKVGVLTDGAGENWTAFREAVAKEA